MPEEERAAGAEQETFKLRSCKHKNCKYRATATMAKGVYNCDYALMTGHTRAAQHPPGQASACGLHAVRAAYRQEAAA